MRRKSVMIKKDVDMQSLSSLDENLSSDDEDGSSKFLTICVVETETTILFEQFPVYNISKLHNSILEPCSAIVQCPEEKNLRSVEVQKDHQNFQAKSSNCETKDFFTSNNPKQLHDTNFLSACSRVLRAVSQQTFGPSVQKWLSRKDETVGDDSSFALAFEVLPPVGGRLITFDYIEPEGSLCMVCSQTVNESNLITCWNIKNLLKPERTFKVDKNVTQVKYFQNDKSTICFGTASGEAEVWNVASKSAKSLLSKRFANSSVVFVTCSTVSAFLASIDGNFVKITKHFSSATLETILKTPIWSKVNHEMERLSICCTDIFLNKILIGTDMGYVLLYEMSKNCFKEYSLFDKHKKSVDNVFWMLKFPDKFISYCSAERTVCLWSEENTDQPLKLLKFGQDHETILLTRCNSQLLSTFVFLTLTKNNCLVEWQIDEKKQKYFVDRTQPTSTIVTVY